MKELHVAGHRKGGVHERAARWALSNPIEMEKERRMMLRAGVSFTIVLDLWQAMRRQLATRTAQYGAVHGGER